MEINITIDEKKLRELVVSHLESILGDVEITKDDIKIETKSKQNYKSEWERAD